MSNGKPSENSNNLLHEPYKKNGCTTDKPPTVTDSQIEEQRRKLKDNHLPQDGFLKIVDNAQPLTYGTFNINTGDNVSFDSGYFVSFQVNKVVGEHRDYDDDEYDKYVYECMSRTGSLPYLGYYGNAEISFHTTDKIEAINIAIDFNQHSIFSIKLNDIIRNSFYERETNPTEGQS